MNFPDDLSHANDFLRSIVKVEACAGRRGHTELSQERLSAVMAAPQCKSVLVRHADHIMRVDGLEDEAHESGTRVAGSENADTRNILDQCACLQGERLVMLKDALASDFIQVVRGRSEANRLGNGGRACSRWGGGLNSLSVNPTLTIISPPPWNGSMDRRISLRP
jgi:hypothetical protein